MAPVPAALRFYADHVLLAAVAGRHLADTLQAAAGPAGAVLGAGAVLMVSGWLLARGDLRVRLFTVTALALGLVLTIVPAVIRGWVTRPVPAAAVWTPGTRYTTVPILLLYSAVVVAVDVLLIRARRRHARPARPGLLPGRFQHRLAASLLLIFLAVPWVADFRGVNLRSADRPWPQTISRLAAHCGRARRASAWIPQLHRRVPCSRLG